MSSISSVGSGLLAGLTASLTSANLRPPAVAAPTDDKAPTPSTRVTLDSQPAIDVVYTRPVPAGEPLFSTARAWASPPQDDISALMSRNVKTARGSLAEQWRGLGGAMLSRFASTPANYRQAMVDYMAPGVAGATGALGTQALSGVQDGAAKVSLKIQTRSGETVELTLLVNTGAGGGNRGLQVEITSSGTLSATERDALAKLADGFDQALEGLGQPGRPRLDLSGLMGYDSSVLSRVDLSVQNPIPSQALSAFTLRLDGSQKSVAIAGESGEIALDLDLATPMGATSAQQREAAIAQHLQQFDAAAQRSHADAALVALFKDAFTQLHATPPGQAVPQADALSRTLGKQVQPVLSGLMDFEARFGGDFEKTNDRGAVDEIGRADYQLSQKTTMRRHGLTDAVSFSQTQTEQLEAYYLQSRHGGMLDTSQGNYDLTKIKDRNTTTTLIETAQDMLTSAVKHTQQQQLLTWNKLVNHRVEEQRETPRNKFFSERLY